MGVGMGGGMGGWDGFRDGRRNGFSSLLKLNKKGKNCAVFCFAGKRIFFFIYDVIVKQFFYKRSTNHYSYIQISCHITPLRLRV